MIAVQSFGLKQELEADLPGTIRKIRDIGFDGIEPLILFQAEQGKMPKNVWAQDTQEIAFHPLGPYRGWLRPLHHAGEQDHSGRSGCA